jgi:hypothetical protein
MHDSPTVDRSTAICQRFGPPHVPSIDPRDDTVMSVPSSRFLRGCVADAPQAVRAGISTCFGAIEAWRDVGVGGGAAWTCC